MAANTVPWWRKAIQFAIKGIRAVLGMPAADPPAPAPPIAVESGIAASPHDQREKEKSLTETFPQVKPESSPELAAEPVQPETLHAPEAIEEPPMAASEVVAAQPESVASTEIAQEFEAGSEPETEPSAPVTNEPDPEAEETTEVVAEEPVAVTEPVPEVAPAPEPSAPEASEPELEAEETAAPVPSLEAEEAPSGEQAELVIEPPETTAPAPTMADEPAPCESLEEPSSLPAEAVAEAVEPDSESAAIAPEAPAPAVEQESQVIEATEPEVSHSEPPAPAIEIEEAIPAAEEEPSVSEDAPSEPVLAEEIEESTEPEPMPEEREASAEQDAEPASVADEAEPLTVPAEADPEPAPAAPTAEEAHAPEPESEPVEAQSEPAAPVAPIPEPPAPEPVKPAAPLHLAVKREDGPDNLPVSIFVDHVYEGPLDLLLDLIRKQDIDIYDIPIAKITAQFLAYVNHLKAGDMDVAGEFIYTASLLIHIKSKMLLPREASTADDAAEDPRRELVERLLEHERFKNAAQMLQQKQMLEAASWTNPGMREFRDDDATEPEIAADTVDLVRIFQEILERARNRPIINVEEDQITVGQMIQFLSRRLTMEDKPVALRRLLSHTHSERALIAMFLALLELVRLQAILLRQDLHFSEIFIKKNSGFESVIGQNLARDDWQ